jgi:hypothetical protein
MGTRSFVGVLVGDKCRAIYVHWDGYLSGVGAELQEYTTQAAVEELISHGDRSSLEDGYYKDRGEDDVDPIEYDTFEDFFEACKNSWGEYYYVFMDGAWYCGTTYEPTVISGSPLYKKLTPYAEAIVRETESAETV